VTRANAATTADKSWNTIRKLEYAKQILELQANKEISSAEKGQKIAELQKQIETVKE
jgi:hypothetical protein